MKRIEDYFDDKGFIVQRHGIYFNAIDANFLNTNYYYQKLQYDKSPDTVLKAIEVFEIFQKRPGIIKRYYTRETPKGTKAPHSMEQLLWYDSRTVSRDNSMGWIVLAGYLNERESVKIFAKRCLKRFSFFQNTRTVRGEKKIVPDFCSFAEWATIIRACYEKPFYPLLLFLDLFFLLDIVIKVIKSNYSNDNSTVFHTVSCLYQKKDISTFLSNWATILYFNFLVKPKGYENEMPIVANLKQYSDYKYDPPIYEVTEELIRKKDFIK